MAAYIVIILLSVNFAFSSQIKYKASSDSKGYLTSLEVEDKKDDLLLVESFLPKLLLKDTLDSNFLFVVDKVLFDLNCMNDIMMELEKKMSTVIITSLEDFNTDDFNFDIIRGGFFKVFIISYRDILLQFFEKISLNQRWAPEYLGIISLNPKIHLNSTIFQSSVQRSKHIILYEMMKKFGSYFVNTYSLYPTEKNINGKLVQKIRLGNWDSPKNLKHLYVDRLKNFNWKVMNISSVCFGDIDFPYLFASENGTCIGSNIKTLEIITNKLSFKFSMMLNTEDKKWGHYGNGTWYGMLLEVYRRKKNFIINRHIITDEIRRDFDISYFYRLEYLAVVSMKPLPFPAWMKLIGPFPIKLWSSIFAIIVIVNLTGFILYKISQEEISYDRTHFLLGITGIIFRQNIIKDSALWTRLFLGIWALATFLLTTAYSSNLVTNLTYPRYPRLVKNFKAMSESGSKLCGFPFSLNVMGVFNSSNKYLREIMQNNYIPMQLPTSYKYFNLKNILKPIKARKCMYISFENEIRISQTKGNLSIINSYIIDDKMFGFPVTFLFEKHSTLTRPISAILSRLVETGIYEFLYRKFEQTDRKYIEASIYSGDFVPIRIIDLQTAFYALLGGYILAFVSFVIEVVVHKRKGDNDAA